MEIKEDIGAGIIEKLEKLNILIDGMLNKIRKLEAEKNDRNELAPSSIN